MFEKFGEFDSVEELNRAAEAQLQEGDLEALKALAEENGLTQEDVEDFIDGCTKVLATPLMAALGKLDVESRDLKLEGVLSEWKNHMEQLCMEDEEICMAVRKKRNCMSNFLGKVLKTAFGEKKKIDDRIVRAAGLNSPIYIGIPGKMKVQKLMKDYYLEKKR